jgi:hypothetical protein
MCAYPCIEVVSIANAPAASNNTSKLLFANIVRGAGCGREMLKTRQLAVSAVSAFVARTSDGIC